MGSVLSGALCLLWALAKWIGLAGLPEDASTWYLGAIAVINAIPPPVYWTIFGACISASLLFGAIYLTEHWDSIRHKVLMLPRAWRYVRITAIGKVPVYYRIVTRKGPRVRQPLSIMRTRKGHTTDIKFDIPQDVHTFHLVVEVPPKYMLLFPHSRSDGAWIETIASSGRRRYKSVFVTHRRESSEWVQIMVVNRYGEAGWGSVRETLRKNRSVWSLARLGRAVDTIAPPPPTFEELLAQAQEQAQRAAQDSRS